MLSHMINQNNAVLTLDPVAADWTEEVGVQAVGFFNLVQQFSDVHNLQRHRTTKITLSGYLNAMMRLALFHHRQ